MYKQGQAGVTKASVSIVFNNSDRARSPVGYEHCEQITVTRQVRLAAGREAAYRVAALTRACPHAWQIVIGGRNKYLINGHVAQPRHAPHPHVLPPATPHVLTRLPSLAPQPRPEPVPLGAAQR